MLKLLKNWNKKHNEQLVDYLTNPTKTFEYRLLKTMCLFPNIIRLAVVAVFVRGIFRPELYSVRELLVNAAVLAVVWKIVVVIPAIYVQLRYILHYTNKLTAPWWR